MTTMNVEYRPRDGYVDGVVGHIASRFGGRMVKGSGGVIGATCSVSYRFDDERKADLFAEKCREFFSQNDVQHEVKVVEQGGDR